MTVLTMPDRTPVDHWYCADCRRWDRVDDRDLCRACGEQHDLVRLLDIVLQTDGLADDLRQAHWRAWDTMSQGDGWELVVDAERLYHAEAEVALGNWLASRLRQTYTVGDLYLAGSRPDRTGCPQPEVAAGEAEHEPAAGCVFAFRRGLERGGARWPPARLFFGQAAPRLLHCVPALRVTAADLRPGQQPWLQGSP